MNESLKETLDSLEECVKKRCYFEIDARDAGELLEYIQGLQRQVFADDSSLLRFS